MLRCYKAQLTLVRGYLPRAWPFKYGSITADHETCRRCAYATIDCGRFDNAILAIVIEGPQRTLIWRVQGSPPGGGSLLFLAYLSNRRHYLTYWHPHTDIAINMSGWEKTLTQTPRSTTLDQTYRAALNARAPAWVSRNGLLQTAGTAATCFTVKALCSVPAISAIC